MQTEFQPASHHNFLLPLKGKLKNSPCAFCTFQRRNQAALLVSAWQLDPLVNEGKRQIMKLKDGEEKERASCAKESLGKAFLYLSDLRTAHSLSTGTVSSHQNRSCMSCCVQYQQLMETKHLRLEAVWGG